MGPADDDDESSGYWAVLEPHWNAVDLDGGPDAFVASFQCLPEVARTLFAAHVSESEIANGGLLQFFGNASGVLAPEAAQAYALLGLDAAAAALREAMAFFGEPYPRDRAERIAALELAHGNDWKVIRARRPFVALDDRFFAALGPGHDPFYDALDAFAAKGN